MSLVDAAGQRKNSEFAQFGNRFPKTNVALQGVVNIISIIVF
jgi:hypothetical protein